MSVFPVIQVLISVMVMLTMGQGNDYQFGYQGGFVTPSPYNFKPNFQPFQAQPDPSGFSGPQLSPSSFDGSSQNTIGGPPRNLVGGIGNEKSPTSRERAVIQMVAFELKPKALMSLGPNGMTNKNAFYDSEIELLSFASQVVSGTNYFFKIRIANNIFHAKVYQSFSRDLSVKSVKPMGEYDSLTFF